VFNIVKFFPTPAKRF